MSVTIFWCSSMGPRSRWHFQQVAIRASRVGGYSACSPLTVRIEIHITSRPSPRPPSGVSRSNMGASAICCSAVS